MNANVMSKTIIASGRRPEARAKNLVFEKTYEVSVVRSLWTGRTAMSYHHVRQRA